MVIDILIAFLHRTMAFFYAVMPQWHLPDKMVDYLHMFVVSIYRFDGWFPAHDLLIMLTGVLSFYIIYYMVRAVLGLISLIRGGGEVKM